MTAKPADRCKIPIAFWQAVERVGLSVPVVLRQAELPPSLPQNANALVTTAQYFSLWRALESQSQDDGLAIKLLHATDTSVMPPSTLAAFHARDYRDGLQRLARFKRLCTPEKLHINETSSAVEIRSEWVHASEAEPAISVNVTFALVLTLGRRCTGKFVKPLRVELTRSKSNTTDLQSFFECPVRLGAKRNLLVLRPSDLDLPFVSHNPALLDILTPALSEALHDIESEQSVTGQVKEVLKRNLASGRPDVSAVANDLGLSLRTLQRRITESGASFRELLIEARQELVHELLADTSVDLNEVAFLLGYQDTNSFFRAFRDWEGVTPSQWRIAQIAGPH